MPILHIEHEIPDYDGWKKAFESDPINRKRSGVTRYRICRPLNEPDSVIVELYFDKIENLETTLQALQKLWNRVQGSIIMSPKTRILEEIESKVV